MATVETSGPEHCSNVWMAKRNYFELCGMLILAALAIGCVPKDVTPVAPPAPTTAPADLLSEEDAEDLVAALPQVGSYLDSVPRTTRDAKGLIFSLGHPIGDENLWEIYVGADHDEYAVEWCRFRVDRRTREIWARITETSPWLTFEQWRDRAPPATQRSTAP
jgi:hypothetical protein